MGGYPSQRPWVPFPALHLETQPAVGTEPGNPGESVFVRVVCHCMWRSEDDFEESVSPSTMGSGD